MELFLQGGPSFFVYGGASLISSGKSCSHPTIPLLTTMPEGTRKPISPIKLRIRPARKRRGKDPARLKGIHGMTHEHLDHTVPLEDKGGGTKGGQHGGDDKIALLHGNSFFRYDCLDHATAGAVRASWAWLSAIFLVALSHAISSRMVSR